VTGNERSTRLRWVWAPGALLGAVGGVFLLTGGVFGLAFVAIALGLIAWKGPRLAALAGFTTGFGAAWLALFLRTDLSCAAMNASSGGTCVAGDLSAWYAAAGILVAVGLALSVLAVRLRG